MKLAFVTIFDPNDIHAWSGLGFYILKALQSTDLQIETIGGLRYTHDFIYKIKEVLYTRVLSKTYLMLWDPLLLKSFASQVEKALASSDCDIVFSIWTNPIAYLRTDKPVVFWGDATFAGLNHFYPGFNNYCAETIRSGNKMDQQALANCRLAIFSSEWAANTAINSYKINPAKIKVVPFGANIESTRNIQDVHTILRKKKYEVCNLLFIGKDWFRKGGDLAVEVAGLLNQRGIPTELHVVGCDPPVSLPEYVKLHGFISKTSDDGKRYLDELFAQAHFFILPTRADCTPVVFSEAGSFGLPVLTTNVGGIPSIISNGKNGQAFGIIDEPEAYCVYIERLFSSKIGYEQLALSSYKEYAERLNWASAGRKVSGLLHELCSEER